MWGVPVKDKQVQSHSCVGMFITSHFYISHGLSNVTVPTGVLQSTLKALNRKLTITGRGWAKYPDLSVASRSIILFAEGTAK